MVATARAARRSITEISHATLGTIIGSLPVLPEAIQSLDRVRGRKRPATFEELKSLRWFLALDDERIVGLMATHDRFDWPTLCDVRELVHLAGSRRAVDDLLRHAIAISHADELPLYGEFAYENRAAIRHAARRGAVVERVKMAIGGPYA